jgi:hypothetical protein
MLLMFILANLDIIAIALLVAAPFYFFNRYLLKKIKPSETGKRLALYFISVLILALLYSIVSVLLMTWTYRP